MCLFGPTSSCANEKKSEDVVDLDDFLFILPVIGQLLRINVFT